MVTLEAIVDHARRGTKFLVIGGGAFLIDAGVFNALVYWGGEGPLFTAPLAAKVIAIVAASIATYLGNHFWTFRDRRVPPSFRQIIVFTVINAIAIGLQLGCLAFSRYVLGLADPISDNISGTIIGQVLATLFRYVAYSRWVFPARDDAPSKPAPTTEAP